MLAGKKSVVFAVPGAFTPTCSEQHLPSFVKLNEVSFSVRAHHPSRLLLASSSSSKAHHSYYAQGKLFSMMFHESMDPSADA
jgi:peroxiredoxin